MGRERMQLIMFNGTLRLAIALAWSLPLVVCVSSKAEDPAHPYHVSRAEVAWNSKSQSLEVALCVWPADLEKAIQKQVGRKVDLDQESNLEDQIQQYLQSNFLVRAQVKAAITSSTEVTARRAETGQDPDAEKLGGRVSEPPAAMKLRWVGQELGLKEAWLYFEIPLESGRSEWTIENRVFFELNEDQLNHVQWSLGKQYETFVCEREQPRHQVSTEKLLRQRERRDLAR